MQKTKSKYTSTLHACYLGYITQAIVVNLAPLFFVIFQNDFGVSYMDLANLVLVTFVVQIATDATMIKLTPILGYRKSAVLAHGFSVVGLVLLAILPNIMDPFTGILISVVLYSIGGGLTEVVISPIVDALPGDAKASAMSLLHAFYSWGQVLVVIVSTVLLAVIGNDHWQWIPLVWALIPFVNLFNFLRVPVVEVSEEQKSNGIGTFLRSPIFVIALLMMICGGASEQAMAQWASLFAERALGVSKVMGDLLGPCLFALFMGIGRTAYGILGEERINIEKALFFCATLTVGCYLVTVFVPIPVFSLLGCAVCGLGVSMMWPGVLAYTSKKYQYRAGPVLFSMLALGGDIGCSLGPWITGVVSDLYTATATGANVESQAIRYGILAAIVFPAILVVLLCIMRKLRDSEKQVNAGLDGSALT